MSGGHFDYKQYQIHDIAFEIEELVLTNDSTDKNDFGEDVGYHFKPETIAKFKEAVTVLRKAAAMAQRVDWLVSGDDGEESFHHRWDEELEMLSHNNRPHLTGQNEAPGK